MYGRAFTAVFTTILATSAVVFGVLSASGITGGTIYSSSSDGYMAYEVNEVTDTLSFSVTTGVLKPGWCVTGYVGLRRAARTQVGPEAHYDVRTIRVCRPYTTFTPGLQYEQSISGVDVTGINRLAICHGEGSQLGNCFNPTYMQPNGRITGVHAAFGHPCTRMWWMHSDSDVRYNSAGDSLSCYA